MSKIQWTEQTWNPITGCSIVSPGCHNCYAMKMATRLEKMGQKAYEGTTKDGRWTGLVNLVTHALQKPLKRHKPTMYFVNSMSDLFHEAIPFSYIDRVVAVMALCPQHTFQVLTKRAERMAEYLNRRYFPGRLNDVAILNGVSMRAEIETWPLPNVWWGVSVEDQKRAYERIPYLWQSPAAVRFLSLEPLLEPVDIFKVWGDWIRSKDGDAGRLINWVIVGGESGPKARPCNIEWIRDIVRQCKEAATPCFVKQLGSHCIGSHFEWWSSRGSDLGRKNESLRWPLEDKKGGDMDEWPEDLRVRELPTTEAV